MINIDELRESIQAEKKRMEKRPVPTDPWIMPLSLDDLEELLNSYIELNRLKSYFKIS